MTPELKAGLQFFFKDLHFYFHTWLEREPLATFSGTGRLSCRLDVAAPGPRRMCPAAADPGFSQSCDAHPSGLRSRRAGGHLSAIDRRNLATPRIERWRIGRAQLFDMRRIRPEVSQCPLQQRKGVGGDPIRIKVIRPGHPGLI